MKAILIALMILPTAAAANFTVADCETQANYAKTVMVARQGYPESRDLFENAVVKDPKGGVYALEQIDRAWNTSKVDVNKIDETARRFGMEWYQFCVKN